jgi:molybdopterin converting factor small subunit
MSPAPVTVRYWASARAAAGVAEDELPVDGEVTLEDVVRRVLDLHPVDRFPDQVLDLHPVDRFPDLIKICSVLVGERPAGTRSPEQVPVRPGDTVEFLPPFAGG